jgi:hypothetical protein
LEAVPTSKDMKEKKYLTVTQKLVLNKEFISAVRENEHMLKYYRHIPDMNDMVLSNYVQTTRIISDLLIQIIEDEEKKQTLYGKILLNEEQIRALTLTVGLLKKKLDTQKKKLTDRDRLFEQVKILENEKKRLQKQIDRLKEIDLNPDKIIGNPAPAESKHLDEKFMPVINNTL